MPRKILIKDYPHQIGGALWFWRNAGSSALAWTGVGRATR